MKGTQKKATLKKNKEFSYDRNFDACCTVTLLPVQDY